MAFDREITIDGETADRIATQVLMEHRDFMREELGAAEVGEKQLHPQDSLNYQKCLEAINYLLKNYFGEIK